MTLKFISSLHWSHFAIIQPGKHGPCQEAPAPLPAPSPTGTKDFWRLRIHFKFWDLTMNTDKFYKGKGLKTDERHDKMFSQKYRFIKGQSLTIWTACVRRVCRTRLLLISERDLTIQTIFGPLPFSSCHYLQICILHVDQWCSKSNRTSYKNNIQKRFNVCCYFWGFPLRQNTFLKVNWRSLPWGPVSHY